LSKECKSFLKNCLQKNPSDRPTARELIEHNFFKGTNLITLVNTSKASDEGSEASEKRTSTENLLMIQKPTADSYNVYNGQNIISSNLQSSSPKKTHNQNYNILKNVQNFHIVGQSKKEDKQIINILSDNQEAGAFFSISMTVYSQQSLVPYIEMNNKENRTIPGNILEVDEPETSPKIPESSGKKTKKVHFIFDEKQADSLNDDSMFRNFLDNYNIKDLNDLGTIEKLNTLELKKEELEYLEKIFKQKSNIA
jgi:serine/threonine protein kinase